MNIIIIFFYFTIKFNYLFKRYKMDDISLVEVEFNYNQNIIIVWANFEDLFKNIIDKYLIKSNLDINEIYFLANGIKIDKNEKIINIMNEYEKENKKIKILVYSTINNNENKNIKKSNDILCPECKEICKYDMKDYKITLYDCKNGHKIKNIKLNEYENTQNIDLSKIICDNCKKKSRLDIYNNEFYKCNKCNMNLCPLFKSIHDNNHIIINYNNKNYICNKHNEILFKYCKDCKKDMCLFCVKEHKNHKIISYEDKMIDIEEIKKKMEKLGDIMNTFKKNIKDIINKFNNILNNMDIYYKINNEIINRYEKNRNYNLLININNVNESIDNEINNIIKRYNYGRNLNELIDIYMKMNMSDENNIKEIKYKPEEKNNEKEKIINRNNNMKKNEENKKKAIEYKPKENNNEQLTIFNVGVNNNLKINKDEIEIKYKPKKNNKYKVRIFGEDFIKNNRNKCKIIYKN